MQGNIKRDPNKIDLYLDYDGVIRNTSRLLQKAYEGKSREGLLDPNSKVDEENFFRMYNWTKLMKRSEVINDAYNAIRYLIDLDMFNINTATKCTSIINENIEKFLDITREFGDSIGYIPISQQIEKGVDRRIDPVGAILVDDYKKNLHNWGEHCYGLGIHFDPDEKENEYGYPVISNLRQIPELIEEYYVRYRDDQGKLRLRKKMFFDHDDMEIKRILGEINNLDPEKRVILYEELNRGRTLKLNR